MQNLPDSVIYRSSRSQIFFKIGALNSFTIFTGKHLCWSLFKAFNVINKRLQHRCYPVNIAKFLRAAFFIEHLRWLLLDIIFHKKRDIPENGSGTPDPRWDPKVGS